MKRGLFVMMTAMGILLMASPSKAKTCWIQVLQDPMEKIEIHDSEPHSPVTFSFSLDTQTYVDVSVGGVIGIIFGGGIAYPKVAASNSIDGYYWAIEYITTRNLQGGDLNYYPSYTTLDQHFGWLFGAGENTISLTLQGQDAYYFYDRTRLEVKFEIEDEEPAVTEGPSTPVDVGQRTLLTAGPEISLGQSSTLFDLNGRKVYQTDADGRVELNTLPCGTYFATQEDGSKVRIVLCK
ncbi:hypothetical protein ES703_07562 [subsurface metagenome]|nr:hypothetical protein [bacterium]